MGLHLSDVVVLFVVGLPLLALMMSIFAALWRDDI